MHSTLSRDCLDLRPKFQKTEVLLRMILHTTMKTAAHLLRIDHSEATNVATVRRTNASQPLLQQTEFGESAVANSDAISGNEVIRAVVHLKRVFSNRLRGAGQSRRSTPEDRI